MIMPVRGWVGAPGGLCDGVRGLSHTGASTGDDGHRLPLELETLRMCWAPVVSISPSPTPSPSHEPWCRFAYLVGADGDPAWNLDPLCLEHPRRGGDDNTVGVVRPGLSCKVPVDVVPVF